MKKNLSYLDSVHRDGRIWGFTLLVLIFAFPAAVSLIFGAGPKWGPMAKAMLAVLPMYSSIEKLQNAVLEASADLGAKPSTTFLRVTLPLTFPGIFSAIILTFILFDTFHTLLTTAYYALTAELTTEPAAGGCASVIGMSAVAVTAAAAAVVALKKKK